MIEWKLLLKSAVVNFGIQPSEFWKMTPQEFLAIIKDLNPNLLSMENFKKLQEKFPDKKNK